MTVEIDSISTSDIDFESNWITIGSNTVSITGTYLGGQVTVTQVQYRYMMNQAGDEPCGITDRTARYYIRFQARFDFGEWEFETPELYADEFLVFETGECASQSISDLEFSDLPWGEGGESGSIEANLLSYIQGLTATVSVSFDACECGACCDPQQTALFGNGGCNNNVVEHLCDDQNGTYAGLFFAGVGTDCDPDPC